VAPGKEVVVMVTGVGAALTESGALYASHIRNEGTGLLDALEEAVRIGEDLLPLLQGRAQPQAELSLVAAS